MLPVCDARGIRIITNAGAANPIAGAELVREIARELGLVGLTIAAVTGDDVHHAVQGSDLAISETGGTVSDLGCRTLSANVYLGAEGIIEYPLNKVVY